MDKYRLKAERLIHEFDKETQKLCVVAIHDWFERYSEDWRYIATALKRKSKDSFINRGFGILFNSGFMRSTFDAIRREDEAKDLDLDDFYITDWNDDNEYSL